MTDNEILEKIKAGWECGRALSRGRTWIQQGGLGRGGPAVTVSSAAVARLVGRGALEEGPTVDGVRRYVVPT